jgi:hypothetical protein
MSFSPAGSFPVGTNPQAVVTADFNNDGQLDLATANFDSDSVSVLLGNGGSSFQLAKTSATGPSPTSLAAGDFNSDGKLDLATANYNGYWDIDPISILLGHGDGTFAAPVGVSTYGESPNSVAAGDMNGDGKLDLVVATGQLYGTVSVLLGHGDGTFANALPSDEYTVIYFPLRDAGRLQRRRDARRGHSHMGRELCRHFPGLRQRLLAGAPRIRHRHWRRLRWPHFPGRRRFQCRRQDRPGHDQHQLQ